jgi:tetratricopeptide (TPR) repeat protein
VQVLAALVDTPVDRRSLRLAAIAVALAAAAAYAPSMGAGYVWDDHQYVAPSAAVQGGGHLWRALASDWFAADPSDAPSGYWRPAATLSLWVAARFGSGPAPQHATNLLLHALSAALLTVALARRRFAALPAALAAAIWALHPEQSEAVAWISCRADLLAAAFALALFALPWRPGWRSAALHGLLFLGGLLSKEPFLAVGVAVLADDLAARRSVREALPRWTAVVAAVAGWLGLRAALHIGSINRPELSSLPRHFLSVFWLYDGRALWPLPLTADHPYAPLSALRLTAGALALAALVLIALRRRDLLPAAALVVAPLGMAAVPIALLGTAPDRYFYLPSIGLAWLLAAALQWLAEVTKRARLVTAGAGALALLCAAATFARLPDWWSDQALFAAAARVDADDPQANLYLGIAAGLDGRLDEARALLERGLAHAPDNVRLLNALAWLHLRRGDGPAARAVAKEAVAHNPGLPQARLNLANAYHFTGAHFAERVELERALKLSPHFHEAHVAHAFALCELERRPECEAELDALATEGWLLGPDARVARVEAAMRRGDLPLAEERLTALRAEQPRDARIGKLDAALHARLARQR